MMRASAIRHNWDYTQVPRRCVRCGFVYHGEMQPCTVPPAAAVRASVERGDPLSIFTPEGRARLREMRRAADARIFQMWSDYAATSATANPPEPDSPQPVTADTEPLDSETDGNYPHSVSPHLVKSEPPAKVALAGEAIEPGWSEETRLGFLARVQRIDPRERRP